ncbi:MAG: hypothetical protein KAX51_04515 [Chromatiaceae bacterium]|nr:hypothetical protein [Chromatiaceae bacterium]MBP6807588.1 hypothetical protein [Chromatiaceae bacterium]MBP8289060.1 hypothetical protein [Chromatiaceae bacterium]
MTYNILRLEESPNSRGEIEVFVQVAFTDENTGSQIPHATWLTGTLASQYLADHDILPGIIATWEQEARERYYDASSITPRQARLALLSAGLLDAVEAYIGAQSRAVQLEWEYASEIRRDNALLATAATTLGMTEAQLQGLFAQAARL